ncbi:MAG: hypothetical protein IKE92_11355 [Clostridiales bacterium]|nr:hypothetical protein [Clostridiales bacterium]
MTDLKRYHEITTDIWKIFRKYYPEESNLDTFIDDVYELNNKYENSRDEFRFMNKLLKVYFNELNRIKG